MSDSSEPKKVVKIPVKYIETDHVFDISKAWYSNTIEITYVYDKLNDDLWWQEEVPF